MTFLEIAEKLVRHGDAALGSGATDTQIAEAERRLGILFRGGYREFLRRFGWGGVGSFDVFGVGGPKSLDVVGITEDARTVVYPRVPAWLLPIMNNGGGDLWCLDLRGDGEPPVVRWWHEDGEDQEPEADAVDFVSWLGDRLKFA